MLWARDSSRSDRAFDPRVLWPRVFWPRAIRRPRSAVCALAERDAGRIRLVRYRVIIRRRLLDHLDVAWLEVPCRRNFINFSVSRGRSWEKLPNVSRARANDGSAAPANGPVISSLASSVEASDAVDACPGHRRTVRSFVRRDGRITPAQRRALEAGWQRFGLVTERELDLDAEFGRRAFRTLEIGFGSGDVLLHLARRHRDRDYIGLEVYEAGLGRVIAAAMAESLTNLRLMRGDACEVLPRCLADGTLNTVALLFPDPWPKKRHHKRRLVQPRFVSMIASKLVTGGTFQLATDWPEYARHMLDVLDAQPRLANVAGPAGIVPRPPTRPATRFERRGERLGHPIIDLEYRRVDHERSASPAPE